MNKQQQIEKMKNKQTQNNVFDILDKFEFFQGQKAGRELWSNKPKEVQDKDIADFIKDINYIRSYLQDSVVLSREEYEKLRSLYDCEQGSYMTSNIGDLPLTVEGLRKAVDEITRLNKVETELQELNAKYYNEAKDLRRELKQARKETAEKILDLLVPDCKACDENWHSGCLCLRATLAEKIAKQFGLEIKE